MGYLEGLGRCAPRWRRVSFGKRAGRNRLTAALQLSLSGRKQSEAAWSTEVHSAAVEKVGGCKSNNFYIVSGRYSLIENL